jgi:tetraacyldisaccharide 4'-kinase
MKRPWLVPLVPLYRLGQVLMENRRTMQRLNWPVVSIGNLSTGGTGKTPLTIALAKALTARGMHVDVLSRGYGRAGTGTALVQKEGPAQQFGDEPVLIARQAGVPVYVDAERYQAGLLAESGQTPEGRAVHLLDDGFQHGQLYREVDILLLNESDWQDRLLPAGNLREDLSAVKRADVVAIPAEETELEPTLRDWGWQGPVWKLHRRMDVPVVDGPAVAFCGIARPEQFFAGLESAGVKLAGRMAFPDHHRYSPADVATLRRAAGAGPLLTTEKDAVRLGSLADGLPLKTVPLKTEIEDEAAAMEWLIGRLQGGRKNPSV